MDLNAIHFVWRKKPFELCVCAPPTTATLYCVRFNAYRCISQSPVALTLKYGSKMENRFDRETGTGTMLKSTVSDATSVGWHLFLNTATINVSINTA